MSRCQSKASLATITKIVLLGTFLGGVTIAPPLAAQDGIGERIGQSIDRGLDRLQSEVHEGWKALKQTVDRLGVEGRVYSRLRWDKEIATSTIDVDATDAGVVTLKGQVRNPDAKQKAVRLARDTVGVNRVIDQLSVTAENSDAEENAYIDAEEKITRLTNDLRTSVGLEELSASEPLRAAATEFARFMLAEGKYGHQADGRRPAQRAEDAGYEYCIVRENIAYIVDPNRPESLTIAKNFFDGWKDSEEHRENMLGEHIRQTAVALASEDGKTFYAVQMFGRPASAKFKIQIKNQTDATQALIFRTADSRDEIEVSPGTTLSLSRCIPTAISLESSEDRLTVKESRQFVITDGRDHQTILSEL